MNNDTAFHIPPEFPTQRQWAAIGPHHHHGVALSLLSLRKDNGSGVGEFLDLIPMIQWCKEIGFDVIQLLPLNDSGYTTSPYSALSAIALHPIYLSLEALPYVTQNRDLVSMMAQLHQYNTSQRALYHTVLKNKERFLRRYFECYFAHMQYSAAYEEFVAMNAAWIHDYALFKSLKIANQEKAWWEWERTLQNPTEELLTTLKETYAQEMHFHTFLQFLAFEQWKTVKEFADKRHLFLKGDVPILINRDSVDVWRHGELFLPALAAGAPPDMYSVDGQCWGFPVYNWTTLEEQNFSWWKMRLHVVEKLYHIFRIDHVVGFFRIWVIADGKKNSEGFYIPEEKHAWLQQGEKVLRMMLISCSALPIGEDLGVVPDEVRTSLTHLGIPGTKVLRWERRWNEDLSFIPPTQYNPLSMICLSTHDSQTLAQWWETQGEDVQTFAHQFGLPLHRHLDTQTRRWILKICHSSSSLFHINLLQEYLALFEELVWQDIDDERINIPGTVNDTNWTYRFRPTIHEITHHSELRCAMHSLLPK